MRLDKRKFTILFFTLLNLQIAFSQSNLEGKDFVEYSKELAIQDFNTAKALENSDSLKNAIRYYKYVAEFDSTSEIGKISISKLDAIWKVEKKIFECQLIGQWNWIWSGTNWGTENSPKKCNCQKYWKFDTKTIIIFEDKKEVERLTYQVEKNYSVIGSGYFFINVDKGENKWRLKIYQEVENAYFLAERNKDAKLFLSFKDEGIIPNCISGCHEKKFEKQ